MCAPKPKPDAEGFDHEILQVVALGKARDFWRQVRGTHGDQPKNEQMRPINSDTSALKHIKSYQIHILQIIVV